jgi:ArsR family transcriptional regulator
MKTDKEIFRIQAEFCKAMAHPVRLEIIDLLKARGLTVHELAEAVGISQANVSQHLAVLRSRGVVRAVRQGNTVTYTLENRKIVDACMLIREILMEHVELQQAAIGLPP